MRTTTKRVWTGAGAMLVAVGCGGHKPPPPLVGGAWPTATVAQGGPQMPPPHVFQPRPHPPRTHGPPPPPPPLHTLPALIDGSSGCFAPDRAELAARAARSGPPPYPMGGLKGSGGGMRSSGSAPARPAAPPAAAPAPAGAGAGRADEAMPMSPPRMAPPPAPPPGAPAKAESAQPSAATPAPMSAPAADRKDRRDRREKKRADKGPPPASAPAAPAMEAAPMDMAEGEAAGSAMVAEPTYADDGGYHDWGQAIYLSNDDTMSLSSAQRVIYAIDRFLPLPAEHVRPHELLNYFSFDTAPVNPADDFSVLAGIVPKADEPGLYSLSLAVRGWPLDTATRRNTVLSFAIDRSGSMSDEGRMEYLRRGLLQMTDQLKTGDMVHLTLFDHRVCVPLQNYVVGRDDPEILRRTIHRLRPEGSTDVHAGLARAYELADRTYQPTYSNRVVLITDALANTGVTDERMISLIGRYYDSRRIRLSGVGVGTEFNDALLDRLTERGRGAYVFLGSQAEVDAVFGSRFVSLIETTANDVHFRLHLPPSLRMNVFYGEESSVHKEDVQAIHYFANTSQLFLQDVMARGGQLRPDDQVMLEIEYEHPETGQEQVEEYAFTLGQLEAGVRNTQKGRFLIRFVDGIAWMAQRQPPAGYGTRREGGPGMWDDPEAWRECARGRDDLARLAQGLDGDPEVRRVLGLWEKYCSRYEPARNPVRREVGAPPDAWPGAR